jgi:hypothetical protein
METRTRVQCGDECAAVAEQRSLGGLLAIAMQGPDVQHGLRGTARHHHATVRAHGQHRHGTHRLEREDALHHRRGLREDRTEKGESVRAKVEKRMG